MTARACPICGDPLPPAAPGASRAYCGKPCKDAANFLAATERAIGRILAQKPGVRASVRRLLRAAANRLGNDWHRPRDEHGRFIGMADMYETGI